MSWKEYDYSSRKHRGVGKIFYRPLLDVEVSAGGKPEIFTALVDSGGEATVMSTQIAQLLGITSIGKQQVTVESFAAKRKGFIGKVQIVVPEFPKEFLVTDVIFSDDVSTGVPYDILLGQEDFFGRFNIRFERSRKKFFLSLA